MDVSVNLTCTDLNNKIVCKCLDSSKCMRDIIPCYNISTIQDDKKLASPSKCGRNGPLNVSCCPFRGCKQLEMNVYRSNHPDNNLSKLFLSVEIINTVVENFAGRYRASACVDMDFSQMDFIMWRPYQLLSSLCLRLNLSNSNMDNVVTRGLKSQSSIRQIDMSYNRIKFIGDMAFMHCIYLKILNLSGNNIQVIGAFAFHGCGGLRVLDFSNQRLKRIKECAFHGCGLKKLNLYGNCIEVIEKSSFSQMYCLYKLDLFNHCINNIDTSAFVKFYKLKIIDLSQNKITRIVYKTFNNLPTLEYLNLTSNYIEVIEENAFFELNKLTKIDLSSQYIRRIGVESAAANHAPLSKPKKVKNTNSIIPNMVAIPLEGLSLKNLGHTQRTPVKVNIKPKGTWNAWHFDVEFIDLSHNNCTVITTNMFAGLHRLVNLNLVDNCIEVIETKAFHDLPLLSTLDLSRQCIRRIHSRAFSSSGFKTIDLSYNLITRIAAETFYSLEIWVFDSKKSKKTVPTLVMLNITGNCICDVSKLSLTYLPVIAVSSGCTQSLGRLSFGETQSQPKADEESTISNVTPEFMKRKGFSDVYKLRMFDKSHPCVCLFGHASNTVKINVEMLHQFQDHQLSIYSWIFFRLITSPNETMTNECTGFINETAFFILKRPVDREVTDNCRPSVWYVPLMKIRNIKFVNESQKKCMTKLKAPKDMYTSDYSVPDHLNVPAFEKIRSHVTINPQIHLDVNGECINVIGERAFIYLTQHFSHLNLSKQCIRELHTKPFSWSHFINIDLSFNFIKTITTETFYQQPKLMKLNLTGNYIEIIEDRAFYFMANIPMLDLSDQIITKIGSNAFQGNLVSLHLSRSKITYIITETFNNLSKLVNLNLSGNCIEVISERAFSNLPKVRRLNLSSQCIHTIRGNAFYKMENINILYLSYNNIWDIVSLTVSLKEIPSLTHLNIAYNNITYLPKYAFEGLVNLRSLDITGHCLQWFQSKAFDGAAPSKGLENIVNLNLSCLCIETLHNESFIGLDKLRVLDLSKNRLKIVEAGAFRGINNLTYLDIRYNKISQISESLLSNITVKTIATDAFRFCCALSRSSNTVIDSCSPAPNQFSSCDDLMANTTLQVFIWIIGISSLIGNTFVIVFRIQDHSIRVSDFCILNLSISDMLMGVYLCIIASFDTYYRGVYYKYAGDWLNSTVCKIAGILNLLSSEVSVFMLLVISVDRFLAIVLTFKSIHMDINKAKKIVGGGWLVMSILCLIPLIMKSQFTGFYTSSGVCMAFSIEYTQINVNTRLSVTRIGDSFTDAILMFNFFVFLLITVLYLMIFNKVRRVGKETAMIRSTKKMRTEIKTAQKLILILATDMCCWMPIIIIKFMIKVIDVTMPADVSAWLAIFVLPLNSGLNPFLFTLSAIQLRKRKSLPHKTK